MSGKVSSESVQHVELSLRSDGMQASPIRRLMPLANAARAEGVNIFHLNIGQPDIVTPPEIMQAVREFKDQVLAYGPSEGLLPLREEICSYCSNFGVEINPGQIIVTTGGSEAIMFALMAIGDPGDEILVPEPFYTNYNGFATMSALKVVPIPTSVDQGFALPEREEIKRLITPRTRAILYCSPNNPTGAILSKAKIEMLAELAIEHNLWLLADEVYREFTYDGESHTSILSIPEISDRAIMLDSISKRFSACGARVGCLISRNPEVIQAALRMGQARLCPPTIEQVGAIAGYKSLSRFLGGMISEYQARRDIVCEELAKLEGAVYRKPPGAFYIMPQLPIDDANRFAAWLLTEFRLDGNTVMVAPGDGFYATPNRGKQEVRIAYVLKETNLRKAIQLLVRAVNDYNSR